MRLKRFSADRVGNPGTCCSVFESTTDSKFVRCDSASFISTRGLSVFLLTSKSSGCMGSSALLDSVCSRMLSMTVIVASLLLAIFEECIVPCSSTACATSPRFLSLSSLAVLDTASTSFSPFSWLPLVSVLFASDRAGTDKRSIVEGGIVPAGFETSDSGTQPRRLMISLSMFAPLPCTLSALPITSAVVSPVLLVFPIFASEFGF